jgi:hypothetical protein
VQHTAHSTQAASSENNAAGPSFVARPRESSRQATCVPEQPGRGHCHGAPQGECLNGMGADGHDYLVALSPWSSAACEGLDFVKGSPRGRPDDNRPELLIVHVPGRVRAETCVGEHSVIDASGCEVMGGGLRRPPAVSPSDTADIDVLPVLSDSRPPTGSTGYASVEIASRMAPLSPRRAPRRASERERPVMHSDSELSIGSPREQSTEGEASAVHCSGIAESDMAVATRDVRISEL